MNRYAREMLSQRDTRRGKRRNPYGSAGGYVDSRGRGRDRAMDSRDYGDYRMDSMERDYRDRADMDMRDYRDRADNGGYPNLKKRDRNMDSRGEYIAVGDYADSRDYRDRNMRDRDMMDNAMDSRDYADYQDREYQNATYDMYSHDYRDGHNKLSSKELKKWEKGLENADGSMGKKYDVEQIQQVAKQMGINFEEYRPETLAAITNSLYSDYCKVLGTDMMLYVKMAKAFLEDDDFEGEPEEKAMLYYKCIVQKDEE